MRLTLGLLTASALTAAPAAAAPQVQYTLSGGSVAQIIVDGETLTPDSLATGTSSGVVEFLGAGGQPISAADNLDVTSYFARSTVTPDLWAIDLEPAWRDLSGPSDDFFIFEYGGNDSIRAAARLADGSLGAEISLGGWSLLGLSAFVGPNSGQDAHAISFSGSDLLDASGAPLGPLDEVVGIELYSSTIDGAAFVYRALPPAPLFRPTIWTSQPDVPLGDSNQTAITLRADLPIGAPPHDFQWSIPTATYLGGTGPTDKVVVISTPGLEPFEATVVANPVGAPQAIQKANATIGLELPMGGSLHGSARVWQKLELWFDGPTFSSSDSGPNPFLDRRLDVSFQRPDGSTFTVPGFFDGDGRGGESGNVWKVRLVPDLAGDWQFTVSFRGGGGVAVADNPLSGFATSFDGTTGSFSVDPRDPTAPGFLARGRLVITPSGYLRQVNGDYWLKGGTNSPENLLAFRGFQGTADQNGLDGLHEYGPHVADWTADDPDLPLGSFEGDRGLIGALNYLESQGVNGLYFLPLNLGGDGADTAPFIGFDNTGFDKTHYALGRLTQWEVALWEASKRGIHLQIVLAETELANETWLDGGLFGTERRLLFRELVARFSHHLGVKWNLSEENDFFSEAELNAMAAHLRGLDPYDSPIAFHIRPNEINAYDPYYGSPLFDAASIQYDPDLAGSLTEQVRAKAIAAGKPWMVDMDENTPATTGLTDVNAPDLRKRVLWDVYLSGGQLEWYAGQNPLPVGGDTTLEDFRTREEMWRYTRIAREFLQELPFWVMEPNDSLITGEVQVLGGAEVFALAGEAYAIYLPDASLPTQLDLSGQPGPFEVRWFDPRQGNYVGAKTTVTGGGNVALGLPPNSAGQDWVVRVQRPNFYTLTPTVSAATGGQVALELRGGTVLGGWVFFTLGSVTGDVPGFPLSSGATLPLVPDNYTLLTLFGGAPLSGNAGTLDNLGRATTTLTLPPSPASVGLTVYHAWVADPFQSDIPSIAVPVTYTP